MDGTRISHGGKQKYTTLFGNRDRKCVPLWTQRRLEAEVKMDLKEAVSGWCGMNWDSLKKQYLADVGLTEMSQARVFRSCELDTGSLGERPLAYKAVCGWFPS
jgi:hypothetical protein